MCAVLAIFFVFKIFPQFLHFFTFIPVAVHVALEVVTTLKLNWGLKRKGGNHYEEISDISIVCINAL